MIETFKDTTSSAVASRLTLLRTQSGTSGRGVVLTLIVVVPGMIDVENAIQISSAVSMEHPCRVIVVVDPDGETQDVTARVNAQIRVGEEVGASEVIVMEPKGPAAKDLDTLVTPLLLADTPVVVYWPSHPPANPSEHPLGSIAVRRITDSRNCRYPLDILKTLARNYTPGDSDVAWAGVTLWRALLVSMFEENLPKKAATIKVTGSTDHPSTHVLGAWMRLLLDIPVEVENDPSTTKVSGVYVTNEDGSEFSLTRREGSAMAHLHRPGFPTTFVHLDTRSTQNCLREELRRLDPDVLYGEVITKGLQEADEVRDND
ncbi:MAG: glucose-6-phosphate dehydrogenase assembly protein OpcA [Actinomycetaceae bacterium]|nr:glucose-6-phosphate dehydrogenase assembly protein OpcA [Actinomycetaceae bacterium]